MPGKRRTKGKKGAASFLFCFCFSPNHSILLEIGKETKEDNDDDQRKRDEHKEEEGKVEEKEEERKKLATLAASTIFNDDDGLFLAKTFFTTSTNSPYNTRDSLQGNSKIKQQNYRQSVSQRQSTFPQQQYNNNNNNNNNNRVTLVSRANQILSASSTLRYLETLPSPSSTVTSSFITGAMASSSSSSSSSSSFSSSPPSSQSADDGGNDMIALITNTSPPLIPVVGIILIVFMTFFVSLSLLPHFRRASERTKVGPISLNSNLNVNFVVLFLKYSTT